MNATDVTGEGLLMTRRARTARCATLALLLGGAAGLLAAPAPTERDRQMRDRLEAARLAKATLKGGRFDLAAAAPAYAAAFRAYGIDVDKGAPADVAALLRKEALRVELCVALDDWALASRAAGKGKGADWQRLLAIARAADPDPWRDRLRDALEKSDRKALEVLAAKADVAAQPPAALVLLAGALSEAGAGAEVVALLRQAQRRHPADFWVNFQLATELARLRPPQWEEAVGFYRAALALRPGNAAVSLNLAVALHARGRLEEALAACRQAIKLQPDLAEAHLLLGRLLQGQGKLAEAVVAFRRALALEPGSAAGHMQLGAALAAQGRPAEAVAALRRAVALAPNSAEAHFNLGNALRAQKNLAGAVLAYRQALRLDPTFAPAHLNLGVVLAEQKDLAGAVAAYRAAIRLDPKLAPAHSNLGVVLAQQGRLDEAVAALRKAIELAPRSAPAYLNLAAVLRRQGKVAEADAALRKANELNKGAKPAKGKD
jgi:tetratricopeptide (TPR) repeat protein